MSFFFFCKSLLSFAFFASVIHNPEGSASKQTNQFLNNIRFSKKKPEIFSHDNLNKQINIRDTTLIIP